MLTEEGRAEGRVAGRPAPLGEYSRSRADVPPMTVAAWLAATLLRWRTTAVVAAAVLLLAALAVVIVPPAYRSKASFVANGTGGLKLPGSLSGLGGTGGLVGLASQLGVTPGADPSESPAFYEQLIRSRELLTRLVDSKFADPRTEAPADSAKLVDLLKVREKDPRRRTEVAIKKASRAIKVEVDLKTNLVRLSVDAQWPELSAAVANRVVDLVNAFNLEQRLTRARAKREFVQGRLDDAQRELSGAEWRLRDFYEVNRQWRTSPNLTFTEGQLSRQVDLASDMYLSLRREFESARISEVNETPVVTVVDSAVAPRKAQWPQYPLVFVTACLVGVILGTLAAAIAALRADWARRHPEDASELRRARRQVARELRDSLPGHGTARRASPEAEIL